jgi:hypothetical protein
MNDGIGLRLGCVEGHNLWCDSRVEGFVWAIKGNWNGCLMNLCFYISQKGKHKKKRQLQAPKWFNIIIFLVFYNLVESLFVNKSFDHLPPYYLHAIVSHTKCHENKKHKNFKLVLFCSCPSHGKEKREFSHPFYDVKIFYWKLKRNFLPSLWLLIIYFN